MIILAPPGSGKSFFVEHQPSSSFWIDQDVFLSQIGWDLGKGCYDQDKLLEADQILTKEKKQGRHIIGSIFWDYIPDAVVLLPLEIHQQYVSLRPDLSWNQVVNVREFLEAHITQHNIPRFSSIQEAVDFCEKK